MQNNSDPIIDKTNVEETENKIFINDNPDLDNLNEIILDSPDLNLSESPPERETINIKTIKELKLQIQPTKTEKTKQIQQTIKQLEQKETINNLQFNNSSFLTLPFYFSSTNYLDIQNENLNLRKQLSDQEREIQSLHANNYALQKQIFSLERDLKSSNSCSVLSPFFLSNSLYKPIYKSLSFDNNSNVNSNSILPPIDQLFMLPAPFSLSSLSSLSSLQYSRE